MVKPKSVGRKDRVIKVQVTEALFKQFTDEVKNFNGEPASLLRHLMKLYVAKDGDE